MGSVPPLLTFLLMAVSGWVHRHQLIVIELLASLFAWAYCYSRLESNSTGNPCCAERD